MTPENRGCPCLYTEPCHQDCTCVKPHMSRGCMRCCRYGSLEQQRTMAERIVEGSLNGKEKDNDGWTIYEWDFGSRQLLSVRVSPDGKSVAFAALVGEEAFHGMIGEKK